MNQQQQILDLLYDDIDSQNEIKNGEQNALKEAYTRRNKFWNDNIDKIENILLKDYKQKKYGTLTTIALFNRLKKIATTEFSSLEEEYINIGKFGRGIFFNIDVWNKLIKDEYIEFMMVLAREFGTFDY